MENEDWEMEEIELKAALTVSHIFLWKLFAICPFADDVIKKMNVKIIYHNKK